MNNTHRFSGHQQVSDITMLLWKLGSLCIGQMETLLYGTDYKHGYLFKPITKHLSERERQDYQGERDALITCMIDVLQELDITQEQVIASWEGVKKEREEGRQWGKEWVEKYGE